MKTSLKIGLAALALAGAAAATPASAQSFGLGFGPQGGITFSYDSGGYCDNFGCPNNFWDLPVYYGAVFWHGHWYDGPVYYRDWYGRREFWIAGDWRFDEWRGPHPSWWREGRYGPALGMEFYRNDRSFHGRWDNDRRGGFNQRDNRGGFNGRDDRGGQRNPLDQRGPQRNAAPQVAPAPQPNRGRSFGPQNGTPPSGFHNRGTPPPAPAAAPATPPPKNGHDDGRHRDHH